MNKLNSNSLDSSINCVCKECGISANVLTCLTKYGKPPKQLCFDVSTYHRGICDYCGEEKYITEVRDFYRPDFKYLKAYEKQN